MLFTKIEKLRKLGKNYWKFWFASAVSMAASNILQFILSLYILEITGSATAFSLMLSIVFLPRLICTPVAGILADKENRCRLMSLVLMGESAVLAVYSVVSGFCSMNVVWVFVLVLALEIGEVFYGACEGSIIPLLVDENKVKDAIAVSKVDDGIVYVLSPVVASFIYTNVSIQLAFVVVMLLDLSASILQFTIQCENAALNEELKGHVRLGIVDEFKEGVKALFDNKKIERLVMAMPFINAFFGATFSVSILYLIREVYHMSAYYYGMYNSITAMTSVIVPVVVVSLVSKNDPSRIFSVSTKLIAMEIAMIGVVVIMSIRGVVGVIPAFIMIIVLDCMTIAEAIPMQIAMSILVQTGVTKELLGRTSSLIGMISMVAVALGELLFGLLIDSFAIYVSIFVGSAGVGIGTVVLSLNSRNNK